MEAGYSGTPLVKKLGIKEGAEIHLAGPPDGYLKLIEPLPKGVTFAARFSKNTDLVHLFVVQKKHLAEALNQYRANLKPSAAVWVSWPKKASKVATDITEDTIREVALPLGYQGVCRYRSVVRAEAGRSQGGAVKL